MQKCCFPKLKKTPAEVDSEITKCVNNVLSNVRDDSDAAVTGVGGREGQTCGKNSPLASFANEEKEGEDKEGVEEKEVEGVGGEEEKDGRQYYDEEEEKGGQSVLERGTLDAYLQKGEGPERNGKENMHEKKVQTEGALRKDGKELVGKRDEEERRRKLWEGERRRNEERRKREEERRMEENLGNPWRLGRDKSKTGEEEEMRREEATRSNAQMERRWNELTSSSRWNDAGRQKDEKETAGRGRQDDFKIPNFSIVVNLQAGDLPGTLCWSCMCENETRRWRRRGR